MRAYTSIFNEKDKAVDIGKGYYVTKIGKDTNGNKCVYVAKGSNKAKAIQTNGNCPTVHSDASSPTWFTDTNDKNVKKGIAEIMEYLGVDSKVSESFKSRGRSRFNEGEFKDDNYYDSLAMDMDAMTEIELYAENNAILYKSQFLPIIKNMQAKIKSGRYDHALAPKLWSYYVENAMKMYAKEMGSGKWNTLLSTKDRMVLATKLADYYYDGIMNGEY